MSRPVNIGSASRDVLPLTRILVDVSCRDSLARLARLQDPLPTQVVDIASLLALPNAAAFSNAPVVLLGPNRHDGTSCHELMRQLRETHPHVSVYVAARRDDKALSRIRGYALAGAGDVFELESEVDLLALRDTLVVRVNAPAPHQLIKNVSDRLRGSPIAVLAVDCLLESFRRRTVYTIEARFGRDHKEINQQLRDAGVIGVGKLLRAGRLAHAQLLAESGSHLREQVASILGFGSAKALSEIWRRARKSGLYRDGRFFVTSQ